MKLNKWESMPKHREPVTKEMISYIINKGKDLKNNNPNNIYTALSDWLVLGQQTGFRRKEWAQDRTYLKKFNDIERNIDNSAAAFILRDFEFQAKGNNCLDNFSTQEINRSSIVNITCRFKKIMTMDKLSHMSKISTTNKIVLLKLAKGFVKEHYN